MGRAAGALAIAVAGSCFGCQEASVDQSAAISDDSPEIDIAWEGTRVEPAPRVVEAKDIPPDLPPNSVERLGVKLSYNAAPVTIVRGQVTGFAVVQEPAPAVTGDDVPAILTKATLAVEQVLCGNPGDFVTIKYRGGRLPGVGSAGHSHGPRLKLNDSRIFVLTPAGDEYTPVLDGEGVFEPIGGTTVRDFYRVDWSLSALVTLCQ